MAAQGPADRPVEYVVESGDTLSELAERYLEPAYDWRDLQQLWHIRDPHRLPVKAKMSIPRRWLRWVPEKAEFASVRGSVTLTVDGRSVSPSVGAVMPEGSRIATGANSFVTLALSDGSRIALPSQSRVRVVRLRKYLINNVIDYRFNLERGRVDTKAAPLTDPSGNVIINTPLAMTAVRGTEYSVFFDPVGALTGTGVIEGAVAVSRRDGSRSQLVAGNFGALTNAQGESRKVELLAAPDLENPERVQTGDRVVFNVTPVVGAQGYHALLAADAGFVESYAEQQTTVPHFEFPDVPNGNQFVRISAIGEGGLRGRRQSYSFSRRLASIGAEVSETEGGFVFRWFGRGEGERRYRIQIFRNAPEGMPIVDDVGLTENEATVRNLPPGVYFWRIALSQTDSEGTIVTWTEPEKLTISNPGGG